MKVVSTIPTNGTFDLERPLHILKKKKSLCFFSFDLKSGMDRWPLSVIYSLMSCILESTLAFSIVNSSLGLNTFLVDKPIVKKMSEIAFLTGQPLGYYGSWSHPLPLEYWVGRGKPLNPYLKEKLVDYLQTELKPKEIWLFLKESEIQLRMVTGQGLVVFKTSDLEYKPMRKTAISGIPSTDFTVGVKIEENSIGMKADLKGKVLIPSMTQKIKRGKTLSVKEEVAELLSVELNYIHPRPVS
ncbi:hypothetical protein BC332_30805 [Capsicum chinense]|nr:hypothetical protein BC332_30805 [Capsicum chinense]